jgi:putative molybdopterin biosynthesis protein
MASSDTHGQRNSIPYGEELLTVEQVQELLQVGRTFAYSLVNSGELPSYRVGRLLRIRREHVDHWLERHRCAVSK